MCRGSVRLDFCRIAISSTEAHGVTVCGVVCGAGARVPDGHQAFPSYKHTYTIYKKPCGNMIIYVHVHAFVCMHIFLYMHVCVYVYICICIYFYIYIYTSYVCISEYACACLVWFSFCSFSKHVSTFLKLSSPGSSFPPLDSYESHQQQDITLHAELLTLSSV